MLDHFYFGTQNFLQFLLVLYFTLLRKESHSAMKRAVVGKILHHLFLRELQVLLVAHTEFRDQETTIIPTMKISLIMFQKFLTQLQLLFQNLR